MSTPAQIVQEAYDHIAPWYLEWVESDKSPRERYTKAFLSKLPDAAPSVLELGCGPGVPILRMLVKGGARVTANDISAKQIELARIRCPGAEFVAGNMADLDFGPQSFDGVLSFYTLFHLPRVQLRDMLKRIYGWLRPGGIFVFNLAIIDKEEIHGEMMGYGMFWSSFGVDENKGLLEEVGFELLQVETVKAGDGNLAEDDPDYDSEFLWIMAQKPRAAQGLINGREGIAAIGHIDSKPDLGR